MQQYEKIFKAIEFAAAAHRGQFRKGTKLPYIYHPLGVGQILIEHGCTEDIVVAGILHDTIEDTAVTSEDIAENFGHKITEIVVGASEPDKSDTWENRKQHTIEYLHKAPIAVLLVIAADKLDNINSMLIDYEKEGEALWLRFNRPKEKQQWYYRTLMTVFKNRINREPGIKIVDQISEGIEKLFGDH